MNNLLGQFSQQQIILVLATMMGAFSKFPAAPQVVQNLMQHEIVQYVMLFTLLYQGGGAQNLQLCAMVTVGVYVAIKLLNKYQQPAAEEFRRH
jgi:hypothetical protein